MLTEILLMTFVKSFQWYVDWNPFNDFCEELPDFSQHTTGSSSQKPLKGFQSTYHWKLFTKAIKRISVNIPHWKPFPSSGMLTEILLMTFVKSFQWYVDWNPFNDFCEELPVVCWLKSKSLKGFQSTYYWKLFTKVIKRISVNIPLEALNKSH
jgi:hypothetical protein